MEIDHTLTNRDSVDVFILTGGGVNVVGDQFKDKLNEENIILSLYSQLSNLQGFFKFANSLVGKGLQAPFLMKE